MLIVRPQHVPNCEGQWVDFRGRLRRAANTRDPIKIPRIVLSIGKPGIGGRVSEFEYDATKVWGESIVVGPSIAPPVAFRQPENW